MSTGAAARLAVLGESYQQGAGYSEEDPYRSLNSDLLFQEHSGKYEYEDIARLIQRGGGRYLGKFHSGQPEEHSHVASDERADYSVGSSP